MLITASKPDCTFTTMSVWFLSFFMIALSNSQYQTLTKAWIWQINICKCNILWFCLTKVLEAQMKVDIADKESLEARRAQQEEESRENCKLISEQKAVRKQSRPFKKNEIHSGIHCFLESLKILYTMWLCIIVWFWVFPIQLHYTSPSYCYILFRLKFLTYLSFSSELIIRILQPDSINVFLFLYRVICYSGSNVLECTFGLNCSILDVVL